jgi:hypothetical protein
VGGVLERKPSTTAAPSTPTGHNITAPMQASGKSTAATAAFSNRIIERKPRPQTEAEVDLALEMNSVGSRFVSLQSR